MLNKNLRQNISHCWVWAFWRLPSPCPTTRRPTTNWRDPCSSTRCRPRTTRRASRPGGRSGGADGANQLRRPACPARRPGSSPAPVAGDRALEQSRSTLVARWSSSPVSSRAGRRSRWTTCRDKCHKFTILQPIAIVTCCQYCAICDQSSASGRPLHHSCDYPDTGNIRKGSSNQTRRVHRSVWHWHFSSCRNRDHLPASILGGYWATRTCLTVSAIFERQSRSLQHQSRKCRVFMKQNWRAYWFYLHINNMW